jgi:hypothetical protein
MLYIRAFMFIGLFFFMLGCSIPSTEKEPNDNLQIILNSNMLYKAPVNINASFTSLDDKDYFAIEVQKSNYYSISLSRMKGLNSRLTILDSHFKPIMIVDDYYTNFGEHIPAIFLTKGIYFVLVDLAHSDDTIISNAENEYTLFVQPLSIRVPGISTFMIQKKPNNIFSRTQKIVQGIPLLGYYSPVFNNIPNPYNIDTVIDYLSHITHKNLKSYNLALYTFNLGHKKPSLPTSTNIELTGVQDFDPILAVFDVPFLKSLILKSKIKTGFSMISDNQGFNRGEFLSNILLKSDQTYIIAVMAAGRLNYKTLIQSQYSYYKLLLTENKPNPHIGVDIEKEPNDLFINANNVKNSSLVGTIDSINDKDTFMIKNFKPLLKASQAILGHKIKKTRTNALYENIVLTPFNRKPLILDIYDAHHNILKTIYSSKEHDNMVVIKNLYINTMRPYYFVVRSGNTKARTFERTQYQLEFSLNVRPSSKYLLELEPNDLSINNKESPLFLNLMTELISGYINNYRDTDYITFKAPSSGQYIISLDSIPNASFIMKIFDQKNNLIKIKTSVKSGQGFSIKQYIRKGSYIKIALNTKETDFFDIIEPYIMTITRE